MREASPQFIDTPPEIPSCLRIIVARSDGTYEIWQSPKGGGLDYEELQAPRLAGWVRSSWFSGKWPKANPLLPREQRIVMVMTNVYPDHTAYGAEVTARLSGNERLLPKLNRRRDGLFHCIHCDATYKLTTCFGEHLRRDHGNTAADWYTRSTAFVNRNGRSSPVKPLA